MPNNNTTNAIANRIGNVMDELDAIKKAIVGLAPNDEEPINGRYVDFWGSPMGDTLTEYADCVKSALYELEELRSSFDKFGKSVAEEKERIANCVAEFKEFGTDTEEDKKDLADNEAELAMLNKWWED